jgi:hypothetical protein
VFSRNKTVPKRLELDGRFTIDHVSTADRWPRHCDYYVTFTKLSYPVELAASKMTALPVVLPRQADWLHAKLLAAMIEHRDVWMFVAARSGDLPS